MSRVRHPPRLSRMLFLAGCAGVIAAIALSLANARKAIDQTWPPFVLVAGLLIIGVVAHRDGLFDAFGRLAARFRGNPAVLLIALLLLVAGVTSVLNLDTSAAFLTPVLVLAARGRGLDEDAFLYGALLMSNAASLLLPGSNLTNLLVLADEHVPGAVFAARMLPAWIAAVVVTAAFVVISHRHRLHTTGLAPPVERLRHRPTLSTLAVAAVVALMIFLRSPALPVLVLGLVVAAEALNRRSLSAGEIWATVQPAALAGVFGLAVLLGTLARIWNGPAHFIARANGAEAAAAGAIASVAVNNLPAAVLFGSRHPAHPRALLLGLNLGPNLAITGSLSALIWFRAAATTGSRPSARRLSRLGLVLVPISISAAGAALWLFAPGHL